MKLPRKIMGYKNQIPPSKSIAFVDQTSTVFSIICVIFCSCPLPMLSAFSLIISLNLASSGCSEIPSSLLSSFSVRSFLAVNSQNAVPSPLLSRIRQASIDTNPLLSTLHRISLLVSHILPSQLVC